MDTYMVNINILEKKCPVPIDINEPDGSINCMEIAMAYNQTQHFFSKSSEANFDPYSPLATFLLTVDHPEEQNRLTLCPLLLPNNSITL